MKNVYPVIISLAVLSIAFGANGQSAKLPKKENETSVKVPTSESKTAARSAINVAGRFDCLHDFNRSKGSSQGCLTVTGLSLSVMHQISPQLESMIKINPFATPRPSDANSPDNEKIPKAADSSFGIIDKFGFIWLPRPHLEVAIESFEGSAGYPTLGRLALGNPFMETGWKQSALTMTYNLLALPDMKVRFAIGNGEGETIKNMDSQQYFGFEMGAQVIKGVHASLGVSLDGNSQGSEEEVWRDKYFQSQCGLTARAASGDTVTGYSTQRMGGGVLIEGLFPGAEGLELALGYQRNILSDLDQKKNSQRSLQEIKSCKSVDPAMLFLESESGNGANTIQRTIYNLEISYKLLDGYNIGLNYSLRNIDTGSVKSFDPCDSFESGKCIAPSGQSTNIASDDSFTIGLGMDLASQLLLSLEFRRQSLSKMFDILYFKDADDKVSKTRELFNARIAYSWK